jgi:hypothetical protein
MNFDHVRGCRLSPRSLRNIPRSLLVYYVCLTLTPIFNSVYCAARVVQWLERRLKDLVILASPVRMPLWDVGSGPSDETVQTKIPCHSRCGTKKNPHC